MTQRSLDPGTQIARYRVVSLLGTGGPPTLNAAFDRSYGASAVAMERTWS